MFFSMNENNKFYPLRMAQKDCINTIDLFLYEEDGVSHYSLIKNFNRLIKSQKTSSKNGKIFICKKCFTHYTKEELLKKHISYCLNNETVSVKMPLSGTMLNVKNHHKQLPIPFVAYADFECFTKPMNTCCPNPKDSYNYNYQKHEPSEFCIFIKGVVDKKIKPIIYSKTEEDEDIPKIFVEKLSEATRGIYNDFYRKPKPLILSKEEQKSFNKAEICHICNKELLEDKVRDHCHFTGQYRGAAHNGCNLNCRKPLILPVIFHNLQGYDAHLFIKQLATLPGDLNCLKKTDQMVSLYFEIRFIDSFKFLQTSLANLVSNLQPCDFHNTKREFKKNVDLLTRKGVYPYDYVSSLEKLSETQLPPKEEFYSKLNDEDITEDDYQHAINVWNTFKCKSLRDYHNLYLKSDVLLLSDVFENFRKTPVDLEYPSSLWEEHNDYPLAPEKLIVNGVEKLICHFKPRKNYVVHYGNLKQYLEMGMRITAVHRGISFCQSPWMEPYIRKNTELRKTASNSFEKDFFKLMNNSVFGKTIENIR
ncbi:unnamed protein product [Porites lobata]|uniref:DNA-directed DNA polymerase n=1 Tax=Porites lobata TaxID=104759 RepID=A0ABN8N398_9CNID|nr:unnamed protein product [Porites lobata]